MLRGAGRFVGDINLDEQVMGYILRSPHAHANILGIDCAQAKRAAGVLGVVTAGDIDGKVGDLPCLLPVESRVGHQTIIPPTRALASDLVRYVGQPVAFIVATSEILPSLPSSPGGSLRGAMPGSMTWTMNSNFRPA